MRRQWLVFKKYTSEAEQAFLSVCCTVNSAGRAKRHRCSDTTQNKAAGFSGLIINCDSKVKGEREELRVSGTQAPSRFACLYTASVLGFV